MRDGAVDRRHRPNCASSSACALYAISKGDARRVGDFYSGPAISGLVNINATGT